jgi:hypothetical protein
MYIEMATSMLSANDALARMRTRYADMINSWSSTLWEEFPASNSNNHAWSAGPLYQLSAYTLGVRPTLPGYNEFIFQPQVTDLTNISATIPSVKGDIVVSYTRYSNTLTQTITNPLNTVAIVGIPKGMLAAGVKQIDVNGITVYRNGSTTGTVTGVTFVSEDASYISFRVQPGSWTFAAYSQATSSSGPVVLYTDCNYGGNAVALPAGRYTLADLIARGMPNDSVSSLRVMNGYQAILYWDTDFGGSSLVKTADDWCLVDDSWNDAMSSIVIQAISTARASEPTPAADDRSGVAVFPNPASNVLTIYPGNSGYQYLYMVNMSGRTVLTKTLTHDASSITVNVSHLEKGVYSVVLKGGRNGNVLKKVVIE